jgi:hypothetical protein
MRSNFSTEGKSFNTNLAKVYAAGGTHDNHLVQVFLELLLTKFLGFQIVVTANLLL